LKRRKKYTRIQNQIGSSSFKILLKKEVREVKTTNDSAGKMLTRSELRKEIVKCLDKKAIELLTGISYNSRDGPGKEIDDFRNEFQAKVSSSIFSRLEYQLIHGFTFNPEEFKLMIKAGVNEEKSIVEWVKNQTRILWPKWKKLMKKFKNEKKRRKENGNEEFAFRIN